MTQSQSDVAWYLRWYTELEPFYRVLIAGASAVGIIALATGLATANVVFLLLGGFWIVVGGVLGLLASTFDSD
jgi:hypothetical protein